MLLGTSYSSCYQEDRINYRSYCRSSILKEGGGVLVTILLVVRMENDSGGVCSGVFDPKELLVASTPLPSLVQINRAISIQRLAEIGLNQRNMRSVVSWFL